ncbi:MAG: hypothetical protein RL681_637 [Candidatus Parcubacteria bacterium]|jgi:hypothetical protein
MMRMLFRIIGVVAVAAAAFVFFTDLSLSRASDFGNGVPNQQAAAVRLVQPNPVVAPFTQFLRRLRRTSVSFMRSWGEGNSAPVLTVVTDITNDNGGTVGPSQVLVHVRDEQGDIVGSPSPGSAAGQTYELAPGMYTVSQEGMPFGYASAITGDCAADGTITLIPGDAPTCVLENDDIQPQVKVVKQVTNDHGGTAEPSNFTMYVTGPGAFAQFPGSSEGRIVDMNAGGYSIFESTVGGYTASFSANCNSSVGIGEMKICVISNNDVPSFLDVSVNVVNDNGGTSFPENIALTVNGVNPSRATFAGSPNAQTVSIGAGPYAITASASGYAMLMSSGCSGTMGLGERHACVVTANDIQPSVIVTTNVVNDNGGLAAPDDFSVLVTGNEAMPSSFPGTDAGAMVTMNRGSYAVDEAPPFGYAQQFSSHCSGAVNIGDSPVCIITANDVPAKLTVIQTVVNDDGGTKTANDFVFTIGGLPAKSGVAVELAAGTYRVSEAPDPGYAPSYGGDCDAQGNVTLAFGAIASCTVTNHDIQPKLTIVTTVTNDSGGTKTAADFSATVQGTAVSPSGSVPGSSSGAVVTLSAGSYAVTPNAATGYASLAGAGCSGTLAVGDERTCVIAYDDMQTERPVTRTGTFWRQYGDFTRRILSEKVNGVIRVGNPARKNVNSPEKLLGAYYANPLRKTTDERRVPLDKSRMALVVELLTARLNCAAFGCSDAVRAVIAAADMAYSGSSTKDMNRAELALSEYNRSGTQRSIPASLGNTGRPSNDRTERTADKRFWNDP